MHVVVVGGAGYIGSHVVLELLGKQHQVTVLDDLSSGCAENLFPEVAFVQENILNREALERFFKGTRVDAVVHLAALKAAGDSMVDPERYGHHNITGSLNLLHAATKAGVRAWVFSSSAAVYGEPDYLPMDEDHPIQPENYYGFTKLQIEQQLAWFSKLRGVRFAALRYFNAAGYDPAGRVRGLERDPKNLIPVVMEVASGKRTQLQIFGRDYDTPDGTCIRDYVHVSDLATAHVAALEYLTHQNADLTLNLGSANGHSVIEVLETAERVVGRPIAHVFGARRAGDPAKLVASSLRAHALLSWTPKHSSLEEMVATTWRAYQQANP